LGTQDQTVSDQADTTASQSASLGSTAGDARGTQAAPAMCAVGRAPDQPISLGQDGLRGAGGLVLSRAWTSSGTRKALWRIAKDYRRVGDHRARAIRLRDAGRRQNPAIAGDFPTTHLSATTGRKK
jgi:hypothetical protein